MCLILTLYKQKNVIVPKSQFVLDFPCTEVPLWMCGIQHINNWLLKINLYANSLELGIWWYVMNLCSNLLNCLYLGYWILSEISSMKGMYVFAKESKNTSVYDKGWERGVWWVLREILRWRGGQETPMAGEEGLGSRNETMSLWSY